jgi:adenosylmethionine-8-amino-7-oxononanoate aminotransferase
MERQLHALPYIHYGFFRNAPAEALAEHLVKRAPAGLSQAFFLQGGSEANEAALKLARQYFVERGEPERSHFIARRQSYHGNTLGALAVSGHPGRREIYEPILVRSSFIAPCYAYREQHEAETPEAYGMRVAEELEEEILRVGPGRVAAFIAETVCGATLGAVAPVPGYFRQIRKICDRYGVLLILDEVMCGIGRTGTLFACEQEAVTPDIVTLAKGLGAGYEPIGAMLLSRQIEDVLAAKSGRYRHGQTYVNHAVGCAASLAVLETIEDESLLAAVKTRGAELIAALTDRFADHPHVGDIRGRGLFIALEFVADRATKVAFPPRCDLAGRLKDLAMANGLMVYPMAGTIDGRQGDHVILAPAYTIQSDEVAMVVERLAMAVKATLKSCRQAMGESA